MSTKTTPPGVAAAFAGVLAAFRDAKDRENAAAAEGRQLRKVVDTLSVGTYGDWALSQSEPSEIVDLDAVKAILTELGRDVPMKRTAPGVVVTRISGNE